MFQCTLTVILEILMTAPLEYLLYSYVHPHECSIREYHAGINFYYRETWIPSDMYVQGKQNTQGNIYQY